MIVDTSYDAAVELLDSVSDETRALAEAAQKLIERPRGIEKRRFVGDLLVRGYSPSAISMKYYDEFNKQLDRLWLNKIHRKVHYSGKLRKISERQEERVLMQGLSLKSERVLRLSEYVEAIEPKALLTPSKHGQEYRRGIQQIKEEVEGLGLDIKIHPADAWGQLLLEIKKHAEATGITQTSTSLEIKKRAGATKVTTSTSLERAGTGTRVPSPESTGGGT